MKDGKTTWQCSNCKETQAKWAGKCQSCGTWDSMVEVKHVLPIRAGKGGSRQAASVPLVSRIGAIKTTDYPRMRTGIGELDRVFGGIVPGSATLVAGDPGIGKSTLFLQALGIFALNGHAPLYVSAEETDHQVKSRADRIGFGDIPLDLIAEKNIEAIIALVRSGTYDIVVVDSIQTVYLPELDGIPGSVSQVKTCAGQLIAAAKECNVALILIGHVTKSGEIAGPRVLEHLVDVAVFFDADHHQHYRILRATKNRFGSANEIGVFEMTGTGLKEVPNPSGIFIADRQSGLPGSVVFPGMEGSRPILLEIQALATKSQIGSARRVSIGFDATRLAMILAVIEARAGITVADHDIYLNVAGGYKITEPAADLAVAAAILSAVSGEPFDDKAVAMGEIGLGGELRPVANVEQRIREAAKLGFPTAFIPHSGSGKIDGKGHIGLKLVRALLPMFGKLASRSKAA